MTLGTVGFGRSFPRIWIVPIGIFVLTFGLAVVGVLSRAVAADFLAWWPVWVGLIVAAVLLRDRYFGRIRAAGLVPLVATLSAMVFLAGHILGWSAMPSSAQILAGPSADDWADASFTASIDGVVEVSAGSTGNLYVVEPARGGGQFGIPDAVERREDSSIAIRLVEDEDPGLYAYSGWKITLAPGAVWTLELDGAVDADLSELSIGGAALNGAGRLELGVAAAAATITISGDFDVLIDAASAASVSGVASVPDSWVLTDTGAEAPAGGEGGWTIVVDSEATVRVTEG